MKHTRDQVKCGRFTGAIGANKSNERTAFNSKRQTVIAADGFQAAEVLSDVVNIKDYLIH